jgi:hypothetical protein
VISFRKRLLRIAAVFVGAGALMACAASMCVAQGALRLDASACADAWASGLERFVRVELGDALDDTPGSALSIAVRCEGHSVEIRAAEGEVLATQRRMDLSGTAKTVRGRVVALAIAGLVRELAVMGRSEEERQGSTTSTSTTSASTSTSTNTSTDEQDGEEGGGAHVVQVDVFFTPSMFTAASDVVWGGGARGQYLGFAPLRLSLDVQAGTYAREEALGSARLVAGSVGARLGYALPLGATVIAVGAGQRLGLARASASANTNEPDVIDDDVLGVWSAPFAFASVDTALSERLRLGFDAELGAVLLPVHGLVENGDHVDVDGAWLALSVSIGVQL